MDVIPAIDLRDGKVVRLLQGQYDRQITYGHDPAEQAKQFHADGAKWLHVVDLDGAKVGKPVNTRTINPCCFSLYVKCFQTGFLCGQRRTDFKLRIKLQDV